jgi:ferredoxin
MSRIGILYFSGTGTTWTVARHYAEAFRAAGHEAELRAIEALPREDLAAALSGYELLGLGYVIHAWNAPRLVRDLIRRLPPGQGQRVFLFVTAAEMAGGALAWMRERLRAKGYHVVHEAPYYLANNLPLLRRAAPAPSPTAAADFSWCASDVQEAVVEILSGAERHVPASFGQRLVLSEVGWRVYLLGCTQIGRHFHVSDACTRCGLCVRRCPTQNTRLTERGVQFGRACTMCLRCLNLCPPQAVTLDLLNWRVGPYLAPGYRGEK